MCPNMNHFDAVDFSECHFEEVIIKFLLTLSVCTLYNVFTENTFQLSIRMNYM